MGCRLMLIINAGRQIDYRQKMAMKATQESRPGRGKAAARRLFLDESIFARFSEREPSSSIRFGGQVAEVHGGFQWGTAHGWPAAHYC